MNKKIFIIFVAFFILFSSCSSAKVEPKINEKLNYTEEDILQNEISEIRKLISVDPIKALWRASFISDQQIKNECIENCFNQFEIAINDKDYFEAQKYYTSFLALGVKVESSKEKLIVPIISPLFEYKL